MRVERILREPGSYSARRSRPADHFTCAVNRLAPCETCLDSRTAV
jgi:hypothetical protein